MTSLSIIILPAAGKPEVSASVIVVIEAFIAPSKVEDTALNVTSPALVVARSGVMSLYPPPFSM
jgi:hypothetical protein